MSTDTRSVTALAVDLDGTLIRGDTLTISVWQLLRHNPLQGLLFPLWLWRGRAFLKHEIAARVSLDPSELDYRQEVIDYVVAQRALGRCTVLASGSDEHVVHAVANHLGCFELVLASDGVSNLTGLRKQAQLARLFGERGYDYIGNSQVDVAVWEGAAGVLVAGSNARLLRQLRRRFAIERVFE
jgi:phosphoserine phosphatase